MENVLQTSPNLEGNTHMRTHNASKKTKLQHQQPDGTVATRTTARDYSHVTLIEGKVMSWHGNRELAEKRIQSWKNKDAQLKAKYGDTDFWYRYSGDTYTVETINNGSRS